MTIGLGHLRRVDLAVRRRATLADFAERMAGIWGDRTMAFLLHDGYALTYDDAAIRVERMSAGISAETEPGDRVLIAVDNSYDQFLLSLAASRAGCLAVPVNSQMRPAELDHVRNDCDAALVITDVADINLGAKSVLAATPSPDDIAALFYTSGTTGKPKGVELTHRALVGQSASAALWPARLRDDEVLVPLPVAHIMGFMVLVSMATAGVKVRFMRHFHAAEVLEVIESASISAFVGVPSMYRMMADAGAEQYDLKSVRAWMSGADVMPSELAKAFKKMGTSANLPIVGAVGEAAFIEGYGMVEVGGGAAAKVSLPFLDWGSGDSVGFKLPGYKFRVVDESGNAVPMGTVGELWIKGPGVLTGYWNDPAATAEAITSTGWLRTGDLVRGAPLGAVIFCGRKKHVLKSGGYSVYPLEVEADLEEHPDVAEAAVIGLPDDKLGEVPAAAVILVEGSTASVSSLLEWASERMSHYKMPRLLIIVDELPRTSTRKVQKDRLVELFEA